MKIPLKHSIFAACTAALAFVAMPLLAPSGASAAGLLIADGGLGGVLEIKEHDVQVTINNGIAVTKVTQVFRNTERRQVEALYTFPVPKGASVANFSMWINGKEMVGEVLEKQKAREIYNSYKRQKRDPGLLEQTDYKSFEMRVFPIAPEAEQKVQITYYQELDYDNDWATYVYPLATSTRRDVNSRTTGKFSISFEVKSAAPIAELESPSHGQDFVIAKHTDGYVQASYETNAGSLARDVVLAHRLERPKTGMDLLTSKRDGEDGFFCLSLTAGEDLAKQDDGMDYLFVLDISGSMGDDGKLLLSKDSLASFIDELGAKDRFEVMTFNVQPHAGFGSLRPASAENKQAAAAYLSTQQARGGTVLNPAITTAYKYADPDRPLNVVILSDGLTEQGERQELLNLLQARPRNARVFCIGVGNDVNRPLLEQLAQDTGGLAAFLSHGDNFARQAKAFRRKLLRPAATDLQLDFGGLQVSDIEPKTLPNLYHGTPVRIYGRYHDGGGADVSLRASINGVELKQKAQLEFPRSDLNNPEIERMWAWHRIDGLLKQADRASSRRDVTEQIVSLGENFSIVTEYTSFLVLENDAEYQRWKISRNNLERTTRDRNAQLQLRAQLDAIRNKVVEGLGPQPAIAENRQPAQINPANPFAQRPAVNPAFQTPAPAAARPDTSQSRDINLPSRHSSGGGGGGGSGPVGPLFIGVLMWLRKLKRRTA